MSRYSRPDRYREDIEVYPATTLRAHEFRSSGYEKFNQTAERKEIIGDLEPIVELLDYVLKKMEAQASADVLDGVVCLLAARDFLIGDAMPPIDRNLAEIEGWIWTRDPEQLETAPPTLAH